MSVTDTQDHGPSEVSRRTLIKAGAGAGVAVAVVGGVAAAATQHAGAGTDGHGGTGDRAATTDTAGSTDTAASPAGALVAHVTDLPAGTVEVFSDDTRTRVTDHDLAARIARAAQK